MKKLSIKMYPLLYLVVILVSCNDNVQMNKSDIEKYPWLIPFTKENSLLDFEGKHNIDLGILEFSFRNHKKTNELFLFYDSVANKEQWRTIQKTQFVREFSKSVSLYEKDGGDVKMKIEIDTLRKITTFIVE